MIAIKEWKWEKVKAKEKKEVTLYCPYCATRVRAESDTRIFDVESGSIKYHIHKCPECFMPIIIGLDGNIIPQSQFLPFNDVEYLPDIIGKMYFECRKCFSNECYCTIVKQVDTNSANLLSSRSRRYLAVIGSLSFIGRQVA